MKAFLFLSLFFVYAVSAQYSVIFQTYSDSNCQKPYKNSAGVAKDGIPGLYKFAKGQSSFALYSPDKAAIKKGLRARVQIDGRKFIGTFDVTASATKCYTSKSFGKGKHGSEPITAIQFTSK